MRAAAALALLCAALAAGAATAAAPAPQQCRARETTGRFAVVPGSAGAGNIVYALTLTNRSGITCFVTGLPLVRLIGRQGVPIPTHVSPALPGATAAPLVRLATGQSARATARFSPDVPGPGEGGACERVAYRLRVRLAGGSMLAPIVPPTRVCSRGAMQFTVYRRS